MATLITDKDYYNLMKDIDTATLENTLVKELTDRNMKISSAESCTGGMISQRITNVSGASNVFELGVCSYANRIKNKVLGVSNETLNTVGAVSQETATQMCEGIKELSSSDIGGINNRHCRTYRWNSQKACGISFYRNCNKRKYHNI